MGEQTENEGKTIAIAPLKCFSLLMILKITLMEIESSFGNYIQNSAKKLAQGKCFLSAPGNACLFRTREMSGWRRRPRGAAGSAAAALLGFAGSARGSRPRPGASSGGRARRPGARRGEGVRPRGALALAARRPPCPWLNFGPGR